MQHDTKKSQDVYIA